MQHQTTMQSALQLMARCRVPILAAGSDLFILICLFLLFPSEEMVQLVCLCEQIDGRHNPRSGVAIALSLAAFRFSRRAM